MTTAINATNPTSSDTLVTSPPPLLHLSAVFAALHPERVAALLERTPTRSSAQFLDTLETPTAAEVSRRLTSGAAAVSLQKMDPERAAALIEKSEPNRSAALLSRWEARARAACLERLTPGLAQEIRELMSYPPNTAGAMMNPRVTTFRSDTDVNGVTRRLRAIRKHRAQDIFLVEDGNRLVGCVAIQDVILAPPQTELRSLASSPVAQVSALSPRDEVLETLQKSGARTLPVVDFEGRVIGVLRQDEILATMAQAATADLLSMVGAGKDERALSSPFFAVRKRLPWLQINLLTAFLAAAVVGLFESTIAQFTALAILLPVVAGQSGNTGAQALAVTMRGLALREIRLRHWWRVASKETIAGMLNGVAVAITTSAAVYVWSRSFGLVMVIFLSMILSMTAAGMAGAIIPIVLVRLRQDPAQSSSIILTTVTDVVGFLSFLGIATLLASRL